MSGPGIKRSVPYSRRIAAMSLRSAQGIVTEGLFALAVGTMCGIVIMVVFLAGG